MAKHCMIDLETLHYHVDCVILTIGAVTFDPKGSGIIDRFYIKPDVDEQMAMGRSYDDATIEWWSTQNEQAREEAFSTGDRVGFREALEALHKFSWNCAGVWSNGASFDVPIIEQAMYQQKMVLPWRHWEVRDTRTLYDITGVKLKDGGFVTSHRADDDAEHQAIVVQRGYQKLMKAGFLP